MAFPNGTTPTTSSRVQFEIAVEPLVLKFLAHHYTVKPFIIRGGNQTFNPYSVFLNGQLDRYRYQDAAEPKGFKRLSARLTVAVSEAKSRYGFGHHLTPAKIYAFNEFVRLSYLRQMVTEVDLRVSYGERIDRSVAAFLNRYGITDDELSLDTATRYYRTHRLHRPLEPVTSPN